MTDTRSAPASRDQLRAQAPSFTTGSSEAPDDRLSPSATTIPNSSFAIRQSESGTEISGNSPSHTGVRKVGILLNESAQTDSVGHGRPVEEISAIGGCQSVYAVVVSYCSDAERLVLQFERLLRQVDVIVWVDNASGEALRQLQSRWSRERVHTLWLDENQGIGAAQNRGIERALACGASHILLMDDDSLPAPDMVARLLEVLNAQPLAAAVGACHTDSRRGVVRAPFIVVRGGRLRWLDWTDPRQVWQVDHVIASGCLIPAPVLRAVGGMREDFFIDWVDIEWCLRARNHGYQIFGACGALLEHSLGDKVVQVLGREIALHAPWRHYYQSRNFIFTLRASQINLPTKLNIVLRQLKRFVVFSTLVPGRRQYFKMSLRGFLDACRGRSGPLAPPGSR